MLLAGSGDGFCFDLGRVRRRLVAQVRSQRGCRAAQALLREAKVAVSTGIGSLPDRLGGLPPLVQRLRRGGRAMGGLERGAGQDARHEGEYRCDA